MNYVVDWAATGSMLSGIGSIIGGIAVIVAAFVGTGSLKRWLEQRQTERKMEVGEQILTLMYRANQAFESIKSNGSFNHEHEEARKALEARDAAFKTLPEDRRRRMEMAQVILNRVRNNRDIWDDLFKLLPVSQAIFGKRVHDLLRTIWTCQVEVSVAAESYAEDDGTDAEFTKKIKRDMWRRHKSGEDPTFAKLEQATLDLETTLNPILGRSLA